MNQLLNKRRLRDYPYLFLFAAFCILLVNLFFRQGWLGFFGQVIGGDYVTLYAAGLTSQTDPARLYDFSKQFELQQTLVEPTELSGVNPFISPPYVAMLYGILTIIPLPWSLFAWTCSSFLFSTLSVKMIKPLIPESLRVNGLTPNQLAIITLSFFPFVEGLQAGQNHALSLLLVTGIIVSAYRKRWFLAGILAGALIYKPQLVVGLLIIWLVWRNRKALMGFIVVATIWIGSSVLIHGIAPFVSYLDFGQHLMLLSYQEGFPGYLIITLYGLLTTLMPNSMAGGLQLTCQIIFGLAGVALAWRAYRQQRFGSAQLPVVILALIYPLALSPYVQFHDLLLIVPAFVGWAIYDQSKYVLWAAVATYLGSFILLPLAALSGIAGMTIIPMGLFIAAFLRVKSWAMISTPGTSNP